MTPKEKAEEMVDAFMNIKSMKLSDYSVIYHPTAKQCARIAVNLHLEELHKMKLIFSDRELHYKFWQEVKQEIETL
jgi:hypothetical protein